MSTIQRIFGSSLGFQLSRAHILCAAVDNEIKTPPYFWSKTLEDGKPGISVRDHCFNVGTVAENIIEITSSGLYPARVE